MQLCWMENPWTSGHGDTVCGDGDMDTQGTRRHYIGGTETLHRRHGDSRGHMDRRHGDTQVRERGDTAGGYQPSWCTLASCLPDLSR